VPLLPAEPQGAVRDALSQLQIAFAREAQSPGEPPPEAGSPPEPEPDQGAGQEPDDAERAKARAKIWTPPGA
jgi:hypothetical protein